MTTWTTTWLEVSKIEEEFVLSCARCFVCCCRACLLVHHKKIKAERSAHLVQSDEYLPRMSDDYTNPKLLLTLRSCTEEECRLCARCHSTWVGTDRVETLHRLKLECHLYLFWGWKWKRDFLPFRHRQEKYDSLDGFEPVCLLYKLPAGNLYTIFSFSEFSVKVFWRFRQPPSPKPSELLRFSPLKGDTIYYSVFCLSVDHKFRSIEVITETICLEIRTIEYSLSLGECICMTGTSRLVHRRLP